MVKNINKFHYDNMFKTKLAIIVYLVIVNLYAKESFLRFVNKSLIKVLLLVSIAFASLYDITLGLLITTVLIMNMMLYETKIVKIAKTTVFKQQIKDELKTPSKKDEIISKSSTETISSSSSDVKPFDSDYSELKNISIQNNNISELDTMSDVEDKEYQLSSMLEKDLLPVNDQIDNIQGNIYNKEYYNMYMSDMPGLTSYNDGIQGFDESEKMFNK